MKVELLAPGGSYETVIAALNAGADAVYTGGEKFGARANADNLTIEQLKSVIDYAHLHGRKIYLTINTLLKENEIKKELYDYLEPLYVHGLDAVIVQDYGVLEFVRKYFPQLHVHASTQMTILGELTVKELKNKGVIRIVTPRELSIPEIKKIKENCDIEISSQIPTFSSVYFASSLSNPNIGGGINIKTKDQDFSMSRKLYLQSSYDPQFNPEKTVKLETHLGYVLAEMKTNLDKTMFQEASATAHDIKQAVTGAKYYLLCDYLDMTPISTTTTDIDEILILRKAKRISSNIRKEFSTKIGREKWRPWYTEYLMNNPYSVDMFKRFINHIFSQMSNEELIEESVLEVGYF